MRIRFIINPISGNGKHTKIKALIKKHIRNYEIFYTKKKGDASKFSQDAVEKKIDAVIAVGGDGTVNECLEYLKHTDTALGVIPCGSGNGFAFHIGMKKNYEKAIKQLNNAEAILVDTCSVNGIPFINVSGIGFDAHIAKLFSKTNSRGLKSYVKLIIQELQYKPNVYKIKYDNINRTVEAYLIAFANASQYGNDAKISPTASIIDGKIDFVIVKKFPKWKFLYFLALMAIGKIHLFKYVEIIQSSNMKIICKSSSLNIDGEYYKEKSPITVSLLKGSIKILKPND